MPETLNEGPAPFDFMPGRVRWTSQQCARLRDAGFLTERYELIDGQIISKMGQKPAHAFVVNLLMAWLVDVFGAEFVRIQSTIDISETTSQYDEPEPDVVVTSQPARAYQHRHPGPIDLLVVVEVSDTSLRFDRSTKAAVYARAGIQEYWVADVTGQRIYVYRQPTVEGYNDVRAYHSDEEVATLARPDAPVRVESLLPGMT